jgi:GR25 family glycosyltransferase involved in LPS biosynthesis
MDLLKNTLYINLENREDRKFHVIAQLRSIGCLSPERFHAVQTKDGAVGCSLSHIKCLELAKTRGWEYVCIIEDDFKCIDPVKFRKSLADFQEHAENDGLQWDVLLLGGNNCPPYFVPKTEEGKEIDYCVQVSYCISTVAYVVRQSYYDTLIQNYRDGVSKLMRDPTNKREYAIDMYRKPLQASGRWFLLVPLTITQLACYSDIEKREMSYDHLMLDMEKAWLFQNPNMVLQNMTCIRKKMF